MAIEYWKLLLKDRYAYLDLWIEFLHERYNKTIPKDTWNLFYEFIQDIGTDFDQYDENGNTPTGSRDLSQVPGQSLLMSLLRLGRRKSSVRGMRR